VWEASPRTRRDVGPNAALSPAAIESRVDMAVLGYARRVYQLRAPHPELARFIEHYWFVTAEDAPVDLRVDVFVDARADLVLNFGAPYTRQVIGGEAVEHDRSNLDAQRLVPIRIVQRGLVRIAGVRFRLGGLSPFARVELRAFTNTSPRPSAILGEGAGALEEAARAERDPSAQAEIFDRFFRAQLVLDAAHERFALALDHLTRSDGNATVQALANIAGVTSRQIDRLFARRLGIAPKTTGRVLRFQRALRALMRDPGRPLAEIAADAGYFDQAHFVKDFRRMTGGVPRGYRGYYPPDVPTDFAPNVVVFLQDAGDPPV
jgi:methylphosphotriester-DNA--protein-cysteine methyltransferase